MFKKYLTLIVAVLLINITFGSSTFANSATDDKNNEKIKIKILELGTGKNSKISVKLKDGTKLKGYVSEITDDHFSVTDSKTGTATTVNYQKAAQVKTKHSKTGLRILAVVVTVGLLALFSYGASRGS